MLRSGARPVAVAPTDTGLELVWETLTDDLKAVQAGKLSLVVNEEPAGIRWGHHDSGAFKGVLKLARPWFSL